MHFELAWQLAKWMPHFLMEFPEDLGLAYTKSACQLPEMIALAGIQYSHHPSFTSTWLMLRADRSIQGRPNANKLILMGVPCMWNPAVPSGILEEIANKLIPIRVLCM